MKKFQLIGIKQLRKAMLKVTAILSLWLLVDRVVPAQ